MAELEQVSSRTTSYGYDSDSKRLKTITVNGTTFTFSYQNGSNQISRMQAVQNTSYTITIDYKHDDQSSTTNKDPARVSGIDAYNNSIHLFTDIVTSSGSTINFNQQDQITGRQTVTVEGAASSTVTTTTQNYTYGYDANHGDALTSMSGTQYATVVVASPPSTTTTTTSLSNNYAFDNVGNFTGNSTLGTASNVNQYGGLINNARGDVTDDGTYAYSYDANDRLIVVTPHDNAQLQLKYGYDSQGRRLWKTAYSYTGGVLGALLFPPLSLGRE